MYLHADAAFGYGDVVAIMADLRRGVRHRFDHRPRGARAMSAQPKASQRAIGWSRALGLSVGLHGLIVLGLVFAGGDAPAKPLQHAIVAELVAKGEEQKKKELPRRVRTTKKRPGPKRAKRPVPVASKATERSADEALKRLEALAGEEADEALAVGQQEQTGMTPRTPRERKRALSRGP